METYKYPAKYQHNTGTVVMFTANKIGELVVVGEYSDYAVGDHRTDWTGPEGNKAWTLVEESKKRKLLVALSKLNHQK